MQVLSASRLPRKPRLLDQLVLLRVNHGFLVASSLAPALILHLLHRVMSLEGVQTFLVFLGNLDLLVFNCLADSVVTVQKVFVVAPNFLSKSARGRLRVTVDCQLARRIRAPILEYRITVRLHLHVDIVFFDGLQLLTVLIG